MYILIYFVNNVTITLLIYIGKVLFYKVDENCFYFVIFVSDRAT